MIDLFELVEQLETDVLPVQGVKPKAKVLVSKEGAMLHVLWTPWAGPMHPQLSMRFTPEFLSDRKAFYTYYIKLVTKINSSVDKLVSEGAP